MPYIEQRDKARKNDRQYDEWEEIYRISRMSWYIKKGDELERKGLKRATFRSNFRTNPGPDELKFTYRLLTSDRERAPDFDDQCKSIKVLRRKKCLLIEISSDTQLLTPDRLEPVLPVLQDRRAQAGQEEILIFGLRPCP